MESLYRFLSPLMIHIDDVLLDPNNPRFAELGDGADPIPEVRFAETKIQRDAYEKMRSDKFDVLELKDTIKTIGFLPMDKIVVREWKANNNGDRKRYVIIEGNRRITALRWLLDLHRSGKETFNDDQLQNLTELEVLLLDQENAPETALWILPGLRHVSGIKEWGPYQKARAVFQLRESGSSPQEAAQSLGLSTRAANRLWRSYLALEQMKEDEEFGEFAEPKLYSFFEEIFKKPEVKNWLEWDDGVRRFINVGNLREMYSWISGGIDDDDNPVEPKLSEAKSIRDLAPILNDPKALAILRAEDGSLLKARAKYEADLPEEWQPVIDNAESTLNNLSISTLKNMTEEDIELLIRVRDRLTSVLADRDKLLA